MAARKLAPKAPPIKGPSGSRTPARPTAAAKHAKAVARLADSAKVVKPTTAKAVKVKGLKGAAPTVRLDTAPTKTVKVKGRAGELTVRSDAAPKSKRPAGKARAEDVEVKGARAKTLQELEEEFESFFRAEIEAELERKADIFNDRIAKWRCQCCDALMVIPRRTTVLHGDYVLVHDDLQGLLVNGERFVPKATEATELKQPGRIKVEAAPLKVTTQDIEVVQPGRFKDPYRHLR